MGSASTVMSTYKPKKRFTGRCTFCGTIGHKSKDCCEREENKDKRTTCLFCKASHDIDTCDKFLSLPLTERRNFVQAKRLCWGCLKWGHVNKDCRGKKACKTCNGLHPTCMNKPGNHRPNKKLQTKIVVPIKIHLSLTVSKFAT